MPIVLSYVQTHLKRQSLLQKVEQIHTLVLSPYYLMMLFLHFSFAYLMDLYATVSLCSHSSDI